METQLCAECAGEDPLHRLCFERSCEQPQCAREDKNTAQRSSPLVSAWSASRNEGDALRPVATKMNCSIQSEEPRLPPDRHLLFMLLRAAFKAASGLARSLVASSKAAFIELQNLPIWGILGITIPFRTFSYVPLIRGFAALI